MFKNLRIGMKPGIVPILDVPGPVRRVAGSGQQCPPRVVAATPA